MRVIKGIYESEREYKKLIDRKVKTMISEAFDNPGKMNHSMTRGFFLICPTSTSWILIKFGIGEFILAPDEQLHNIGSMPAIIFRLQDLCFTPDY